MKEVFDAEVQGQRAQSEPRVPSVDPSTAINRVAPSAPAPGEREVTAPFAKRPVCRLARRV